MTDLVKEEILALGRRKTLVAIGSIPPHAATIPDAPMVLILNAGIIHRVGPNRLHVEVARALARMGYRVVRVDLSGIGDSVSREEAMPPLEAALTDIREALDSLEEIRAAKKFVLMGLCSGADHAVIYAGTDPRVIGIILIDPSIPQTLKHFVRFFTGGLVRLMTLRNLVRIVSKFRMLTRMGMQKRGLGTPLVLTQMSAVEARDFIAQAYRVCLDQGVQMLAIFTDGRRGLYGYREQMLDAFPDLPFGRQLRLEYLDKSDHTLSLLAHRNKLLGALAEWLAQRVSEPETPSRSSSTTRIAETTRV